MVNLFQASAEAVGTIIKRFPNLGDAGAYLVELAKGEPVAASYLPHDCRDALGRLIFASPAEYAVTRIATSFALAGIASTGSLLLDLSDPDGRSATALPPVHAVFLMASTIASDLSALQKTITKALASSARGYISITTGPSRTADIERVLTIGVHGPKELHVLIVEGA